MPRKPRASQQSGSRFAFTCIPVLLFSAGSVHALNNGVARTPPMGWNAFGTNTEFTAADMMRACDALVSTGLRDCGYIYCNNDGNTGGDTPYWPGKPGFVNYFKPIADYAHAKGLKYGVYMTTTSDPTASARDLNDAGIDFLKHDDWGGRPLSFWKSMSDALVATGRPIVYSTNSCSDSTVTHMYRTGPDIDGSWSSMMGDYDANYGYLTMAGPGHWPDPDMMVTQWLANSNERRSHMAMWCMMAAPLIICWEIIYAGTPSASIADAIAVHSNTEVIAVDQDALGKAGRRIKGQNNLEVWIKDLDGGFKAVAFLNRTGGTANGSISQAELGWGSASQIFVRDLWAHADVTPFTGTFTRSVSSHDTQIYKMGTVPVPNPGAVLQRMERSSRWLEEHGRPATLPPTRALSVMQGADPRARVFDVRGRTPVVDNSLMPGSGRLITSLGENGPSTTLFVWPAPAAAVR